MKPTKKYPRTLALHVSRRGIAFVYFIDPFAPHDWGTKELRGATKHTDGIRRVKELIARFKPEVLVVERTGARGSRRVLRVQVLYRAIAKLGTQQRIKVRSYSRDEIREVFAVRHALTKREISCVIAAMVPALAARLPRERKFYEPETAAQGIFDAASLGLSFFVTECGITIADGGNATL